MDDRIMDLYRLPDISEYEEVHLLTLRENCAILEAQLQDIVDCLPEHSRQILEAYMDMRNDLEVETVKAALRFGKRNYR